MREGDGDSGWPVATILQDAFFIILPSVILQNEFCRLLVIVEMCRMMGGRIMGRRPCRLRFKGAR